MLTYKLTTVGNVTALHVRPLIFFTQKGRGECFLERKYLITPERLGIFS